MQTAAAANSDLLAAIDGKNLIYDHTYYYVSKKRYFWSERKVKVVFVLFASLI